MGVGKLPAAARQERFGPMVKRQDERVAEEQHQAAAPVPKQHHGGGGQRRHDGVNQHHADVQGVVEHFVHRAGEQGVQFAAAAAVQGLQRDAAQLFAEVAAHGVAGAGAGAPVVVILGEPAAQRGEDEQGAGRAKPGHRRAGLPDGEGEEQRHEQGETRALHGGGEHGKGEAAAQHGGLPPGGADDEAVGGDGVHGDLLCDAAAAPDIQRMSNAGRSWTIFWVSRLTVMTRSSSSSG